MDPLVNCFIPTDTDLLNAPSSNVAIPLRLENTIEFKELTDDLKFRECNIGVGVGSFNEFKNTVTGYICIAPKTMKPMSMTQNVQTVMWVLKGNVTVRSTKIETSNDGKNLLPGKTLGSGACIVVPPDTPYQLENNDDEAQAIIGYVMIVDE